MILNHCEQGRDWPYDLNIPGDTQELCGLLKCIKLGVWTESWNFFFFFFFYKFRQSFIGIPAAAGSGEKPEQTGSLACSLPKGCGELFP